jgi:hypothetical protein
MIDLGGTDLTSFIFPTVLRLSLLAVLRGAAFRSAFLL